MNESALRILFVGDIVGTAGVKAVCRLAPLLKEKLAIDICVANGENAAGGLGITGSIATKLYENGVDGITLGNHVWSKWELAEWIATDQRMARPANGGREWPGRGYFLLDTPKGKLAVINLMGSVYMNTPTPFPDAVAMVERMKTVYDARFVLVDFHAEATSEKIAMGYHLDGRASAVVGTHTHVQTADAHILPKGTGYISDVGMTGPDESVIGMSIDSALRRFVKNLPARYELAKGVARFNAVILALDPSTGLCVEIERLNFLANGNVLSAVLCGRFDPERIDEDEEQEGPASVEGPPEMGDEAEAGADGHATR